MSKCLLQMTVNIWFRSKWPLQFTLMFFGNRLRCVALTYRDGPNFILKYLKTFSRKNNAWRHFSQETIQCNMSLPHCSPAAICQKKLSHGSVMWDVSLLSHCRLSGPRYGELIVGDILYLAFTRRVWSLVTTASGGKKPSLFQLSFENEKILMTFLPQAFNQSGATDNHKRTVADKANCQCVSNIHHFSIHIPASMYYTMTIEFLNNDAVVLDSINTMLPEIQHFCIITSI